MLEHSRTFGAVSVICPSLSATEERDDDTGKRKSRRRAKALPVVRARPLRGMQRGPMATARGWLL
jgi:hypothetical protein